MTYLPRRTLLAASLLAPLGARAQTGAFRPPSTVRMIVPFTAGGSMDSIARVISRGLEPRWGQTVVVENRTGAFGNIGAEIVARSAPDGTNLVICSAGMMSVSPHLYKDLSFSLVDDLAPVALLASLPNVMVVPASHPARDVAGFIAHARSSGKAFTYCSPGSGSSVHVAGALFALQAGLQAEHVAYRGSSPALIDLAQGRIDVMFENMPGALPYIRDGRLRALAVTSPERSPELPDVPTIAEAGMPAVTITAWFAAYAQGRTPLALRQAVAQDIASVQQSAEGSQGLRNLGLKVEVMGPEALGRFAESERNRLGDVVRAANIKVE